MKLLAMSKLRQVLESILAAMNSVYRWQFPCIPVLGRTLHKNQCPKMFWNNRRHVSVYDGLKVQIGLHFAIWTLQICIKPVLDWRPKFYGRSRSFRTYGDGYGGRSLRPFLRLKVFIGIFPRFFQNVGWNVFLLHRCHLRLMWIMIVLSLKIKTGLFLMRFL